MPLPRSRLGRTLPVELSARGAFIEAIGRRSGRVSGRLRGIAAVSLAALGLIGIGGAPVADAATVGPGWTLNVVAQPTNFSSSRNAECNEAVESFGHELEHSASRQCERYLVTARNEGSGATDKSTVTLGDTLPEGLVAVSIARGESENGNPSPPLTCELTSVSCTYSEALPPGGALVMVVDVEVLPGVTGSITNSTSISGGGAQPVATSVQTTVGEAQPSFGVTNFALEAFGIDGALDLQAGDHPNAVTASFQFATMKFPEGSSGSTTYLPAQDVKDITVELPLGFVGDPQATPRCPEYLLRAAACPTSSRIGTIGIEGEGGGSPGIEEQPVFNVVPEQGYPAEFGFEYLGREFAMFASVVPTASGYRLHVTVPGIPRLNHFLEITGITLTLFGDPATQDGGVSSPAAFFANPMDCSSGPLTAKVEIDSWQSPGVYVAKEATTYPHVSGCDMLQFQPTIAMRPESLEADAPSGYDFELRVPQAPNLFPVLATPELKDTVVALPTGVSVSPSAANGLQGCSDAQIGLSSSELASCPKASQVATVRITTPLLSEPLEGEVFVGTPRCSPCNEADAREGRMLRLFIQAKGSGVVIKLPGTVSADPVTGRLTATFANNPQLPFSDLQLQFKGGPRAPLANPLACGSYTTTTVLSPWSSPETPDATPSSSFEVPCAGSLPFTPSFSAGTITPTAGAFSPFTLTLSRSDRQQYLSGVAVQMPPGLLGMLSQVQLCPEPQASNGTCGAQSLIGHTTTGTGPGSQPFYVGGNVFLTGPYKRAPFGLSVVVHALAGPFDLGNVIVRAAINIDPHTAQITVTSDPLPQIIDGVPLRIQKINVITDKPGFMFNPTNCSQQYVTGTVTGAQGASASVSSPFAVAGCATLPFKPSFTASTQARTSKVNGASLDVKISAPGQGPQTNPALTPEANIKMVDVQLPLALPSRLTTLQKACVAAQFEANPAGCPAASIVGTAIAHTPVLPVPLEGPAFLVSHAAAAFPDLVIVLQGDGVVIDLTGNTLIRKGITYSKFDTTPDAPISSFELKLPEGPHSVLAAYGNLCAQTKTTTVRRRVTLRSGGRVRHVLRSVKVRTAVPLLMPTTITFQNGGVVKQSTKIAVTGCPRAKKAKKARRTSKARHRNGKGRK